MNAAGARSRSAALAALLAALLAAGLAAILMVLLPYPASADAPTKQAWWNLANQGVQPPDPPDVPPDGLLVQSGPNGPSAVAALRFQVDPGASVTGLTLTATGSAPPQAAGVLACPTTAAWTGVQNGAWSALPAYDCSHSVIGVLVGTKLVFTGIGRLVSDSGDLAVALVPGQTDRIALARPGQDALAVSPPPPPPAPPPAVGAPPPIAPPPAQAPAPPVPAQLFLPATPVLPAPAAVPAPQAAPPVVAAPAAAPVVNALRPAAAADDTRTRIVVGVEALLVLLTFGLVGAGPAGALARLTGQPAADADATRGVGRFARPRTGSAPRL